MVRESAIFQQNSIAKTQMSAMFKYNEQSIF
jgi:hypothetical protein